MSKQLMQLDDVLSSFAPLSTRLCAEAVSRSLVLRALTPHVASRPNALALPVAARARQRPRGERAVDVAPLCCACCFEEQPACSARLVSARGAESRRRGSSPPRGRPAPRSVRVSGPQ